MKISMNFGDLPTFTPNTEKVLAAISFLIEEAEKLGYELTQYEIVKTIFKADERHLNEAGRPVTYDNYIAMQHGPVGETAINMLNSDIDWSIIGLTEAPWARSAPVGRKAVFSGLSRPCDHDALSPSDERILLAELVETKAQGFTKTRRSTHRNPAWYIAYGARVGKAAPMDWRLIARHRDDALIDELVAFSSASA